MMGRNTLLNILRGLAKLIPPITHATGLSNRIIKPLYCVLYSGQVTITIWGNIVITLDPCDCVGGNLCFIPHLYDRWERQVLAQYLRPNMTFVDLGANIGAYSLWASKFLGSKGEIVAIEADPITFKTLEHNLHQNRVNASIVAINKGISDQAEELPFSRNQTGNSGGNTFLASNVVSDFIQCDTLLDVLIAAGVKEVNFIKINIEGFELKVLNKYFKDVEDSPNLKPEFLLIEIFEGPMGQDNNYLLDVFALLETQGYEAIEHRGNSLFRLKK